MSETRSEHIVKRPAEPTGVEAVWYDDGHPLVKDWILVYISGPGFTDLLRRINPMFLPELLADKRLKIERVA